jgi:hypothetical protein
MTISRRQDAAADPELRLYLIVVAKDACSRKSERQRVSGG